MGSAPRSPFRSFFQGGFEGSTHRRRDGRQLDLIAATRHDEHAATDYRLLRDAGLETVRDALRWHLIERRPGQYDWSSLLPMLRAARQEGVQAVWDLCHYGVPHDLDIWSPAFIDRFAAFVRAAARVVRDETNEVPVWCSVNEVSFWAWSGGDHGGMYPYAEGQGDELKRQLARAAIAGMHAAREVDPRARFVQAEPLINVIAHPDRPWDEPAVARHREAQFSALDMIAGRVEPGLGGQEGLLDIIGVNFYFNNQWIHLVEDMGMGHRLYRPLALMLADVHARYGRPMLVSETGVEGASGPGWLRYVAGEVRAALRAGLPVEGLCLYPVMDYPGWDDERHCHCGLIHLDAEYRTRTLDAEMAWQVEEERVLTLPLLRPRTWLAAAE